MEEKIKFWQHQLKKTTEDFQAIVALCEKDELFLRPSAEAWSIADILQHLIQITQSYYPVVKSIRDGSYSPGWIGRRTFVTRFFGNLILQSTVPENKRKSKTIGPWIPIQGEKNIQIIEEYLAERHHFIGFVAECKDLLEQGIIIHSPAARNMTYTLEKGFDIIIAHEKRHLLQAEMVVEYIKTNRTDPEQ